jgi:hypothetical protein
MPSPASAVSESSSLSDVGPNPSLSQSNSILVVAVRPERVLVSGWEAKQALVIPEQVS